VLTGNRSSVLGYHPAGERRHMRGTSEGVGAGDGDVVVLVLVLVLLLLSTVYCGGSGGSSPTISTPE
jgi:hypothetical protein